MQKTRNERKIGNANEKRKQKISTENSNILKYMRHACLQLCYQWF